MQCVWWQRRKVNLSYMVFVLVGLWQKQDAGSEESGVSEKLKLPRRQLMRRAVGKAACPRHPRCSTKATMLNRTFRPHCRVVP